MTIKQIAGLTGISVATVSPVMNHKDTVKEHIRQKIPDDLEQANINPLLIFQMNRRVTTLLSEEQITEVRYPDKARGLPILITQFFTRITQSPLRL